MSVKPHYLSKWSAYIRSTTSSAFEIIRSTFFFYFRKSLMKIFFYEVPLYIKDRVRHSIFLSVNISFSACVEIWTHDLNNNDEHHCSRKILQILCCFWYVIFWIKLRAFEYILINLSEDIWFRIKTFYIDNNTRLN
jgi:hypothetical protein